MTLCGSGYVVDHCIAAFLEKQKQKLYQIYVTDSLKLISENTANFGGGQSPERRYADIIESIENPKPEVTAEEVIYDIRSKLANMAGS